jgi:hypothetical protein
MHLRFPMLLLLLTLCLSLAAVGQDSTGTLAAKNEKECGITAIQTCALHVAQDEWGLITAPMRWREHDARMVAAFGIGTTIALASDTAAMGEVGVHPDREKQANRYSNYAGLYAPPAALALGFLVGSAQHNHHLQKTTILAEEAMVDSFILNTGLGYAIDRQTPKQGDGKGKIWPNGARTWPDGQSMPSDHSILVWSFARVVASEYPGWATKLTVYSLATSVSASRVVARKHFPSDVFVGAVLGYTIGGYVVHRRSKASALDNISLAPVRTPNGNGIEIAYNFAHR